MIREEAEKDGVKVVEGEYGRYTYFIPCEICGRRIRRTQYSRKRNYVCDYCKGVIKEKKKIMIPEGQTKHDLRFDSAVQNIKKSVKNFDDYRKAISIAQTRSHSYGSVPEAVAAIELLKNKLKIIPQQRVGKYKIDFVIPDLKILLEIDGKLYHANLQKEGERDFYLQMRFGSAWTMIHFPAEYIEKDVTKLVPYIRARIQNDK